VLLVQGPDIQQMGFRIAHFSRVHQGRRVWLEHNLVPRVAPGNGLFCSAASRSRLISGRARPPAVPPKRSEFGLQSLRVRSCPHDQGFLGSLLMTAPNLISGILLHTCATAGRGDTIDFRPYLAAGATFWKIFAVCAATARSKQDRNLSPCTCLRRRSESGRGKSRRHNASVSARSAQSRWLWALRQKAHSTSPRGK
jgi:hypothetical protein